MEERRVRARLQNSTLADFEIDEHGNVVSILGIPLSEINVKDLLLLASEDYFDILANLTSRDPVDQTKKKLRAHSILFPHDAPTISSLALRHHYAKHSNSMNVTCCVVTPSNRREECMVKADSTHIHKQRLLIDEIADAFFLSFTEPRKDDSPLYFQWDGKELPW